MLYGLEDNFTSEFKTFKEALEDTLIQFYEFLKRYDPSKLVLVKDQMDEVVERISMEIMQDHLVYRDIFELLSLLYIMQHGDFEEKVTSIIFEDEYFKTLMEKNYAYGNSAICPIRKFSQASNLEQLYVRIDDKLSRIAMGTGLTNESIADTLFDLSGYLILLLIVKNHY